ncbi:hypothetical protein SUGI_0408660 [Cryptomeria japonica]|uniref:plant UBX domain-containing protein 11 n=1 Tax=Cryptomeria japonica TaxID=3369 RepID=UPI002408B7D3|nr:plant UBX domain-containing protein 11 [Cryptomeria japonica]GLJ21854.1 hypothetical protein SUGI_0408660 [Cryptomeria japonica]
MDSERDNAQTSAQTDANSIEENSAQMEGSLSSLAFKGPVSQAIVATKTSMKILFVYIGGPGEDYDNLEQSTWRDPEVVKLLSDNCVVLYLPQESADALQFSAIYPHTYVPAMSAVGYNGLRLWYHEGYISAKDLIMSIEKARNDLHFQEAAVANMIAAAIASSRQEPVSSIPSLNTAPPVHEEITGSTDPSPSLGSIPLNQSSRTEETEQIVVASRADEQENVASASTIPVPDMLSRPTDTFVSECCSTGSSALSSSLSNETSENSSPDPMHKEVEAEKSVDVQAYVIGNINSQTGDKDKSRCSNDNDGKKIESYDQSCEEQTINAMSSDLGGSTLEILPEIETDIQEGSPVMDDQSATKLPIRDLSSIHLQIRLLNGSSLQAKFAATETLTRVKHYIKENRTDGNSAFSLAIPYPRKVFSEEDMEKTLVELNLGTRAAIILVPYKSGIGPSDWHSSSQANTMGDTGSQNSETGPGFFARILSYINPFSYFGGSSSNQESTSRDSVWQYGPNPSLQDASKDVGQNRMYTPKSNIPGKGQKVGSSSKVEKRGWGSNIHTLKRDEDESFRDRNAFWNGNSTQYGGDDSKRD